VILFTDDLGDKHNGIIARLVLMTEQGNGRVDVIGKNRKLAWQCMQFMSKVRAFLFGVFARGPSRDFVAEEVFARAPVTFPFIKIISEVSTIELT
jgi:hypothetical protein